jgi:hypothetical protein
MKKLLLLLILFSFIHTKGQNRTSHTSSSQYRTTAMKQRVIASKSKIYLNGGVGHRDTCTYYYSGTNGSTFNHNTATYAVGIVPACGESMCFYSFPSLSVLMNIDSAREIIAFNVNQGYDTVLTHISYNANGLIDSLVSKRNSTTGTLYYNSLGMPELGINGNSYQSYFVYNAAGKLIGDSSFAYRYRYIDYNAAGNVSSVMDRSGGYIRTDYEYYPNNSLRTRTSWVSSDSISWNALSKDTFGYSNTSFYTYRENFYAATTLGILEPWYKEEKHLNAANLPDTIYQESWINNAWLPTGLTVVEYNNFDNPTRKREYTDFINGVVQPGLYKQTVYYYELYNDNLSVADHSLANTSVFPNPFTNTLTIQWNQSIEKELTASIYNVFGQLVKSELVAGGKKSIDLRSLVPGSYWVSLEGLHGKTTHQVLKK